MSTRYLGGLVRKTPLVLNPALGNSANGVFTIDQAMQAVKNGTWPAYDPYFENTTLLLHGDGTNGAQNNTFLDSSTNNFTITRNGNTTQGSFSPFSQTGWSNYFDGSGDYLTVPTNSSLNPSSDTFTAEFWCYASPVFIAALFGNGLLSGGGWQIWQFAVTSSENPTTKISVSFNGTSWFKEFGSMIANTWNHVAMVKSGTNVTVYINGTSAGSYSDAPATVVDGHSTTGIGISPGWNGGGYPSLNGYLSNVRMVKGTAVYTSNFTPSTTPLTAISGTSLLTCQSNRFRDASSNNFAITVNGNTSVQAFSPFAPTAAYSTATVGGSGYFDGSGDYLTVANNPAFAFGTGDFTIEGWVYILAAGDKGIFQQGTSHFPTSSSNSVALGINNSGTTWQIYAKNTNANSTATYSLNTWTHFALVRSGTTTTLYINGASVITVTSDSTNYTGEYFGLGAIYGTSGTTVNALLSSVRVVKGTAVYTGTFTPPTAPSTAIANTSLLCNFTNAGIFDNTAKNVLETVGNAQISTSVKKYGTGSLAFDGSGDYLTSNAAQVQNFTFGTGDFTVEFWLYLNSTTTSFILDMRPSGTDGAYPVLYNNSGSLEWFISAATRIASSSLSTGQWYHVAVCRSGTSTKMFLNGTQTGSTYTDSNNYICATTGRPWFGIAAYNGTAGLNGYIDDLRITKGIARYTANFTPPTSQLQDQ